MKRFKAYERHQSYLLPPSPREWLPADHLAHSIDEVVDRLDLCEVFASYEGTKGQPPYHPEMMKLGQVAIDGTKLKANASKHKALSY